MQPAAAMPSGAAGGAAASQPPAVCRDSLARTSTTPGQRHWLNGTGEEVPGPAKIRAQVFHEEPKMLHYSDFVTDEEVQHLLQLCEGRWELSATTKGTAKELLGPSRAENSTSIYGEESVGETRTSHSVHLHFDESYVVERIAARVATVTGSQLENIEPLVLLRYEPGQFFKLHHDGAFRPATVFVYLNDVEEGAGGDTYFPHLGLKVRPAARTAVMWRNRTDEGAADKRMMHEATPLLRGVKYGMNCFVSIHGQRDASHVVITQIPDAASTSGGGGSA